MENDILDSLEDLGLAPKNYLISFDFFFLFHSIIFPACIVRDANSK